MKPEKHVRRVRPAFAEAVRSARDKSADGADAATPAAVLKAEFPDVIEIAGRTFLPFRLNTLRALQAVKSPIIAHALGHTVGAQIGEMDALIAFWIFTTELPEVRNVIGRGMDAVRGAAEPLGDTLDLGQQFELGKAVGLHIQGGFVTILAAAEKDPALKKVLLAASGANAASNPPPASKPASPAASVGQASTR